jgi:antitoxin (DNA-binding transcriptional repressor) of toxin-antitoxin stability system
MRVVGIKQLKARLSEYLRDVRRGEVFLVTDRDEVVAELRPATVAALPPRDELEQAFDALAQAGDVQLPRASREGWSWKPDGAGLPDGTVARLLDELRGERGERS